MVFLFPKWFTHSFPFRDFGNEFGGWLGRD